MTVDRQLEVARALILEHLDVLQPDIDKLLDDPAARSDARIELRDKMRKSAAEAQQARTAKVHAQKCLAVVSSLVPEGTDEEAAREFAADARGILSRAAHRGEKVTPETVPQLLAQRVKLYGFDKPAASASKPKVPAAATPEKKPAAAGGEKRVVPVNDKTRAIAERGKAPAKPVAPQARVRRTQAARNAGSKVAPAGAGAAPVQLPAVPSEAETDVASMSKHLREKGLPESWNTGAE
jgi:hypothetical protein